MKKEIKLFFDRQLSDAKGQGLYKSERIIESSQSALIEVSGKEVLNF